jgi:hypothetical protein
MVLNMNYYQPPEDNSGDLIADRMSELMKGEYNPESFDNFVESIAEASKEDQAIIEEMLQRPISNMDYYALGRKLFMLSYDRMEKFAENHARENYTSGYLND